MKLKKREILATAAIIIVLVLWTLWPKNPGNAISITVDGEELATYSLLQNLSLPLNGYNNFSLTLVIEDGRAHVEDSTCPDLICQQHDPISKTGEQIVCLPARIIITVMGEEAIVDAVAQ